MSHIYALHDVDPNGNGGCQRINLDQAQEMNARGFGIFHTVNEFDGRRQIVNLTRINAWAIDMDGKDRTKADLMKLIMGSPLIPTMVVETASGYHVYWAAEDGKPEHWNAIVLQRLLPFYGADPRARDLARILRRPGFFHMKDPANPFLIRKLWEHPVAYTEKQMMRAYPAPAEEPEEKQLERVKIAVPATGGFWERVFAMDCEDALTRISGHPGVSGEHFAFKPNRTGTKNIVVNGKSTSCWLDKNGRIGSFDGGGPSIYQWVNWYHRNPKRTAEILANAFPELGQSHERRA